MSSMTFGTISLACGTATASVHSCNARTGAVYKVVLHIDDQQRCALGGAHGRQGYVEKQKEKKNDENRIRTCAVRDQTLAAEFGVEREF